mmetsp:Transcript_16056/g.40842  ORF Transcript_16056/g.40842 Transcript_16056/m.40842 type:complete len:204 (+) Transcript_16056:775-1386(+)
MVDSAMSAILRRVGSAFPPAPQTQSTSISLFLHSTSSLTLVWMLSMASITKSGLPPSTSSMVFSSKSDTSASTSHSGQISANRSLRQRAFGMPTSLRVARACRLSEESVTWSKSTSLSLPTPERSKKCAAWLPTPPSPTTTTKDLASFSWTSSPKNWMFLVSCSLSTSSCSTSDIVAAAPPLALGCSAALDAADSLAPVGARA